MSSNTFVTVRDKNSTAWARVYVSTDPAKASYVYFFRSHRIKNPTSFLSRNPEVDIAKRFAAVQATAQAKVDYRASRKVERALEVGDILSSSWGYNMTIVTFYRVTELVGAKSVRVAKISSICEETGWMSGKALPNLDDKGEALDRTFRVNGNGIKISSSESAYKWEGRACYYNHAD